MRRLPAAVLVLLLAVTMSGCKVMQRISDGAYRNAVSDGVVDELDAQGIKLRERPDCESPGRETDSVVRVDCTARTTTGEPVVVEGSPTTPTPNVHSRPTWSPSAGGRCSARSASASAASTRTADRARNPHTERKNQTRSAYTPVPSVT